MSGTTGTTSLNWKVHPFVEQTNRSIVLLLVLAGVLLLVGLNFPNPVWILLSAVLLFGSLTKYFLPTTYQFSRQGVEISFLGFKKFRAWDQFQSFHIGPTGVLLSPFKEPHRLENFRGEFVLFGSNREEVIEFVRTHVEPKPENLGKD